MEFLQHHPASQITIQPYHLSCYNYVSQVPNTKLHFAWEMNFAVKISRHSTVCSTALIQGGVDQIRTEGCVLGATKDCLPVERYFMASSLSADLKFNACLLCDCQVLVFVHTQQTHIECELFQQWATDRWAATGQIQYLIYRRNKYLWSIGSACVIYWAHSIVRFLFARTHPSIMFGQRIAARRRKRPNISDS